MYKSCYVSNDEKGTGSGRILADRQMEGTE